jgi:hypothetical protein
MITKKSRRVVSTHRDFFVISVEHHRTLGSFRACMKADPYHSAGLATMNHNMIIKRMIYVQTERPSFLTMVPLS